jgi:glycosyltransferase involved in cell wall biosynthesis
MAEAPRTTVCTATYNRADVLSRAIDSVLAQATETFEYIVVDDGSTDDTDRLLAQYDDPRLTTISLDRNHGPATAWNRAIDAARGRFVSFLDSDDEYLPGRLRRTAEALDRHPEAGGIVHSFERVATSGTTRHSVPDRAISAAEMADGNPVGGTSNTMYRTAALESIGGFDPSLRSSIDYDLQLRIADAHGLVGIDEVLARKHNDRSDRIQRTPERIVAGRRRLLDKHGSRLTPRNIAAQHCRMGLAFLRLGNERAAREQYESTLETAPRSDRPAFHHRIGVHYLEHGESRRAHSHLWRAIAAEPWRYKSWMSAGVAALPVCGASALATLRTVRDRVSLSGP